MPRMRLTFSRTTEVTNPGDDSRSFLFPFSVVAAELVGAPEEAGATTAHRLIVTIANNRLPAWQLTDAELVKVLFEIGNRAITERVKAGTLTREHRETVSCASHSRACPFDPSRIRCPDGAIFEIEEKKRIGFK